MKFFSRIKQLFQIRLAFPTILLLVGLFLFFGCLFGWFGLEDNRSLFKVLEKAGDLILISSVITFLIDSAEYLGIFKKELSEVIYEPEFLAKRKDIEKVWIDVSKVLFNSKFPQISTDLMMAVKNYYTADQNIKLSYYDDYKITYYVDYVEGERSIISVKTVTRLTLKVEDTENFNFPMRFWTCVKESEQNTVDKEIKSLKVNKEIRTIPEPSKRYNEETGMLLITYDLALGGKTEYELEIVSIEKQNLKEDNYLGFRAKWLVKDMRVQIFHPKDMSVLFVNRATASGFEQNKNSNREDFKEYEYKGLILKHQGYILILNQT